MANKIQLRRDTTVNWETVNPILSDGEPGLDITVNKVKYGDGSSVWTDLLYAGEVDTTPNYKGFKAHYGSMYDNYSDNNGPINKLVIYKSSVTSAASEIDTTTDSDDFQVTGLTGSDVVAMLVVVSDNVTQTPLEELKSFVEAIIDNVILTDGVEGNVRTVANMKTAFYDNFNNFNTVISSVKTSFDFYTSTSPNVWPIYAVNDGGNDEYDDANAIHTDLAEGIIYNDGNVVSNASEFGGGDYVVTYQDGIFGIFATGADIDVLGTGGEGGYGNDSNSSGFDGDGIGVTGDLELGASSSTISGDKLTKGSYNLTLNTDGSITLPNGSKLNNSNSFQFATDNTVTQSLDIRDVSGAGFYTDTPGFIVRSNSSKSWTFGTTSDFTTPGEIVIQSQNAHGGAGYAGMFTLTNFIIGATNPNKFVRLDNTGTLEILDSGYANTLLALSDSGNLTVKGEIQSAAGTGAVTLQASDGSNPRNFVFNTSGSLSLPHLASGGQGAGAFDANNNLLALTSGDTVDFAAFSGMILVNCHNSGTVSLYLCGGGAGNAVSIGHSQTSDTGTMAHNNGIAGYTFTATETGNHVFCAIRTRTGA